MVPRSIHTPLPRLHLHHARSHLRATLVVRCCPPSTSPAAYSPAQPRAHLRDHTSPPLPYLPLPRPPRSRPRPPIAHSIPQPSPLHTHPLQGSYTLFEAAKCGDVVRINELLANDAEINAKDLHVRAVPPTAPLPPPSHRPHHRTLAPAATPAPSFTAARTRTPARRGPADASTDDRQRHAGGYRAAHSGARQKFGHGQAPGEERRRRQCQEQGARPTVAATFSGPPSPHAACTCSVSARP